MAIDQLILELVAETLEGDSGFTAVIPASGIRRTDGQTDATVTPRCELRVISFRGDDVTLSNGTLTTAWSGAIQVDLVLHRNDAYGGSDDFDAGDMETAIDRVLAMFDNQTLTITGFGLATLVVEPVGTGADGPASARRYFIIRFNALTGSNRRLNGADITVAASGLGDRVILGFSESNRAQLIDDTGDYECTQTFVTGQRRRDITLLAASTSAAGAKLDVAPGTTLSSATITRDGDSYSVNLLVHSVRPAPVRHGASDLHYTELNCVEVA